MLSCGVCVSVCLSVNFVDCVKTNKDIFEIFSPSGSHSVLVFPHQTGWRYTDVNPPNGGVECKWGRQKTRFWTNIWLSCIQVYSVRVANCKKQRRASSIPWRPSSVVRTRRRRSVCDRLDVICRREGQTPPDTTLMVITPVFCCRRTS